MLTEIKKGRARYGLKLYLSRQLRGLVSRYLYRVTYADLIDAFAALGIRRGMTVCAHSALSKLGYVEGGAHTLIHAMMKSVGEPGCLLMPTFSMGGSMATYVNSGESFDVRSTPSRVGSVTDAFWRYEGVQRSLHPTNSMAGWGDRAGEYLRDHEKSPTPYGRDTPYGRLAESDSAYILMLETHIHSFLHHLQERVDFPNLFLPGEPREVSFIDIAGASRTMRTRLMRPRIPYFVAVPGKDESKPDWAILHDYALMFPKGRGNRVSQLGYRFDGFPRIYQRRDALQETGALKIVRIGKGECGLLHVRKFLAFIEPELRELIDRYRSSYNPERIEQLGLIYD